MIDLIWEGEKYFLADLYRTDKRKFILDIQYWMHYFYEKPILDKEFPAIEKDFEYGNHILNVDQYLSDYTNVDLFFKGVRIRILYGKGNDYVRIKLRTLLTEYGYRRRSKLLIQHIKSCMLFYNLEATLRGGNACDIESCNLDKMLIFRIV
ncbi:MAG: hypothetical protein Q4C12_03475 [Clostridia bacterium]|nr:hypothetical protein [Clostridia bacterium]